MKPTSLIINSRCLKAYEQEGMVYPVAPIQEFIQLKVINLEANRVKEFELDGYNVPTDLMSFLVKVDYPSLPGSDENLQDGMTPFSSKTDAEVDLAAFESGNLLEHIKLVHGDFLNPIQGLLFRKETVIQIKSNIDLSSITYYCTPVYHSSIVAVNEPNKYPRGGDT